MTLVELLVSMAVMAVLMAGLGTILSNVTSRYQGWVDRIQAAQTAAGLAANLQEDSHRFVICSPFGQNLYQLDYCLPQDLNTPQVRYQVSTAPFVITRQQPVGGTAEFMARGQTSTRPTFWADCATDRNDASVSGHVHVYDMRPYNGLGQKVGDPGYVNANFSVYYVAPWRPGC
jgi:hypothetical protein